MNYIFNQLILSFSSRRSSQLGQWVKSETRRMEELLNFSERTPHCLPFHSARAAWPARWLLMQTLARIHKLLKIKTHF